jgi:hypothetical protein
MLTAFHTDGFNDGNAAFLRHFPHVDSLHLALWGLFRTHVQHPRQSQGVS